MRFMTMSVLLAVLAATAIASAQHADSYSKSAQLGTTGLRLATTVTTLSSTPGNERYRLRGTMTISLGGRTVYSANPWTAIGAGADANGIDSGFTGIAITDARLAYLAGNPQADAVVYWMGCGANCSSASAFFTYDPVRHTYDVAKWAHQPDWDTVGSGHIVHVDATHDVIATTQPSPFDDCHACLPGTVPVFYAIVNGKIADVGQRFPSRLRSDATAAWSAYTHVEGSDDDATMNRNAALYRYLADECRLGSCAAAWHRVQGALPGSANADALSQMRSGINNSGFGRL